jgi:hypothetical protein
VLELFFRAGVALFCVPRKETRKPCQFEAVRINFLAEYTVTIKLRVHRNLASQAGLFIISL